jgi:hypothetical protein
VQPRDLVPDGVKEPADFPILALVEIHQEMRLAS